MTSRSRIIAATSNKSNAVIEVKGIPFSEEFNHKKQGEMTKVTADAPRSTYGIEVESKTADSCGKEVMFSRK